jgi:hypothetical protein
MSIPDLGRVAKSRCGVAVDDTGKASVAVRM